jgi:hypothetical protein
MAQTRTAIDRLHLHDDARRVLEVVSSREGDRAAVDAFVPLVQLAAATEILAVHRRLAGTDDPGALGDSTAAVRDAARAVAQALVEPARAASGAPARRTDRAAVAAAARVASAWTPDPAGGVQSAPGCIARHLALAFGDVVPARPGGLQEALAHALAVLLLLEPANPGAAAGCAPARGD